MQRILRAALGLLLLLAFAGETRGQEAQSPAARLRPVQPLALLGPSLSLRSVDEGDAPFGSRTRVVPREEESRTRNVILGALLGAGAGLTLVIMLRACGDRWTPLDPAHCDPDGSVPDAKAWVALPLLGAVVGAVASYYRPVTD